MRVRSGLVLLVTLAACPRGGGRAPAAAEDAPVELAALAAELDPGEVAPLLEGVPSMLTGMLPTGVEGAPPVLDELRRRLDELPAEGTPSSDDGVKQLIRLLLSVSPADERAAATCDVACLGVLERFYAVLDVPPLADTTGLLATIIDTIARAASPDHGAELTAYLRGVFRRAHLRHRYVAVRLLRRAPGSPEALAALRTLARHADRDDQRDLARRLWSTVVARAPAADRPRDEVELARTCYRALRLACGDRHLAAARAAAGAHDAALATALRDIEPMPARARAAARLQPSRRLEDRLRLGHALVDLGSKPEAVAVFRELAAQHPRDARPLVGEARARFDLDFDGPTAKLLARASRLEHRDLGYYEMAIGTAFTRLLPVIQRLALDPDVPEDEVLRRFAAIAAPLRAETSGLERFDPARAAVIAVMLDGVGAFMAVPRDGDPAARTAALRREVTRLVAAAGAVRRAHPREPAAHRLALMLTRFEASATPEVEAILFAPIPDGVPERIGLLETRAAALATFVVSRDHAAWLPRFIELAAALPDGPGASWEGRNLRADAAALAATASKRGWREVEATYRALLAAAPDAAERARLHNNIGVALFHQGAVDDARAQWLEAMGRNPELQVADINQAAAGAAEPVLLERLADLTDSGARSGVQFQAAAWRRHLARSASPSLADLRRDIFTDEWGAASDGGQGVILDESFQVSLGYSTTAGLTLAFPIQCRTWLVLPAPGT
ncbi:MAG TPA: hypothetical protein VMZ28_03825 [Kofleriaceae bacterium]|nr:hypothetical protein [Kofleriaceae bacterium]